MPRTLDMAVGILMAVMGVAFLAYLPKISNQLAELERTEQITAEDARTKRRAIKLVGLCSFFLGCCLIIIYTFKLYD